MTPKITTTLFPWIIFLFLTACGGDGGGGNGKRGINVTPDLSGAKDVAVGGSLRLCGSQNRQAGLLGG